MKLRDDDEITAVRNVREIRKQAEEKTDTLLRSVQELGTCTYCKGEQKVADKDGNWRVCPQCEGAGLPVMKSKHTCYLLVQLAIGDGPPRVVDVRMFSERTPTVLLSTVRYAYLTEESGSSYEKARTALVKKVAREHYYEWVRPFLYKALVEAAARGMG